ncbi:membrane protein insertion efficiency factor YidD [bacterium]|nr:membrane protein insertion efficiency factor YidD [bacterium]
MWNFIKYLPRHSAVIFIKFYQKTLSFDHGLFKHMFPYGYCRFRPTCSDYAIESIEKYGMIKGGIKATWRILRCNPWNKGGYDPVDKEKQHN